MTNTEEDTDVENILHSDRFEVEEDSGLLFWLFRGPNMNFHQHTTGRIVGRQVSPGRRYSGQGVDRVRCQVVDRSSRKQVIKWNIASCASLRNDVRSGLGRFDLWALRVPNSRPLFSIIGPTREVCNISNLVVSKLGNRVEHLWRRVNEVSLPESLPHRQLPSIR